MIFNKINTLRGAKFLIMKLIKRYQQQPSHSGGFKEQGYGRSNKK